MKNKSLVYTLLVPFICISLFTRLTLLTYSTYLHQLEPSLIDIVRISANGFFYDIVTFFYAITPALLISLILPKFLHNSKLFIYIFTLIGLFILIFEAVAEVLFWDEFSTRFNFIAIDYLIYTQEVVRNIYESYPLFKVIFSIFLVSTFAFWLIKNQLSKIRFSFRTRILELTLCVFVIGFSYIFVDESTFEIKEDRYANELAHNGLYNLFAAFKNNSLNYKAFYLSISEHEAFKILRQQVLADGEEFVGKDEFSITRKVYNQPQNKKYNVMLIVVESLSAEYLARFGDRDNRTPFLNDILKDSLLFTNFYATGTRTVRGLEAIMLSVPPTPGNSIVRRPNNENLFSLGSVLTKEGYDLKFLYGGYGYFDNMNYFFQHNHFKTIDRSDLKNEEIVFANAWGVADEVIFKRAIKEADISYSENKPFFNFIMTTSNHRPFTYPEGRINIPSGTGREGAVKYSDYAIKELILESRNKPWFKDTIFIITADHCAGSAGKTDLPVRKYHIPLIIYAPDIIEPKEIDTLASQIDFSPTILNFLGISYESKFFGSDIISDNKPRALFGTFQKLGYYTPGYLIVLGPKDEATAYKVDISTGIQTKDEINENKLKEAISFYQSAYYLYSNSKLY